MLHSMLSDLDETIEVIEKCNDLPSGVRAIKKNHPDIVFLDLELPVYSGLQLLEFFNEEEIDFKIIFTTASNQHAIQAFEMSAVDYILKPIREEKLQASIQKFKNQQTLSGFRNLSVLKQNLQSGEKKKIILPVLNGYEFIELSHILYLKAEGSYTILFLQNNQQITASKNLRYFEDLLENVDHFVRIHRSYIANLHAAKRIVRNDGGYLILANETQLPIGFDKIETIINLIK